MQNLPDIVSNRRRRRASRFQRDTALLVMGMAALSMGCARRPAPDPLPGFPRLILWAWETPEDLRFLNPRAAGVAFLARSIRWHDGNVEARPRLQPLRVQPGTPLMAVVRLESAAGAPPPAAIVAADIVRVAALPGVRAVQVDFDARLSERSWYREMLRELRASLPQAMPLGITALASWCQRDDWMTGLPVTDAVPMLFRMGQGEEFTGSDFSGTLCRASVGVSTDELPRVIPRGRRLFVFHPRPWTEDTYRGAVQLTRRWQ